MRDCLRYNSSQLNPIFIINSLLISIVLFLHHTSYTNDYFSIIGDYNINELLQKFAVGGFFFFSGLKLSISHSSYKTTSFVKNRLIKIYILYFIALIISSFTLYPFMNKGVYPTVNNFILHALCVQTIFPDYYQNNFHTLWFVSMLFICYIMFIFLRNDINNIVKYTTKLTTIVVVISVLYLSTSDNTHKIFSQDFSIYLLFFSFGMLASRYSITFRKKYHYLVIGFVGNFTLMIIYNFIHNDSWYKYILCLFLVIVSNLALLKLLCWFVKSINYPDKIKKTISSYSTASFCVFLFHRSIWSAMATIYPKGTLSQWVYIVFLGVPVIIFFSYFMQLYFNFLVNSLTTISSNRQLNARQSGG